MWVFPGRQTVVHQACYVPEGVGWGAVSTCPDDGAERGWAQRRLRKGPNPAQVAAAGKPDLAGFLEIQGEMGRAAQGIPE